MSIRNSPVIEVMAVKLKITNSKPIQHRCFICGLVLLSACKISAVLGRGEMQNKKIAKHLQKYFVLHVTATYLQHVFNMVHLRKTCFATFCKCFIFFMQPRP